MGPRWAIRILAPSVIGVLGLLLGAGAMWWLARPAPSRSVPTHLTIPVTPAEELNAGSVIDPLTETPSGALTALTWTPDGRALVFVGRRGGVQQIYMRQLDAAEAVALKGTEGAQVPAVSADGRWIAFWAGGAIRKVPVGGGPVMNLATLIAYPPRGLAWDDGGAVYFGAELGPISKILPEGAVQAVTTTGQTEVSHEFPCPLPRGLALLYTLRKREWSWGDEEVSAHTFSTGASKVLLRDAADARYVPTGHLVFLRRGTLFAVPFDPERLELRGREVPVVDTVARALISDSSFNTTGAGQYAVASTGALAWVPGRVVTPTPGELVVVDRRGQVTALGAPVRGYGGSVRLSPDGRQLAVTIYEATKVGLWTYDIMRGGTPTPVNQDGESEWPLWTPDGTRLVLGWLTDGRHSIAIQPADGTAPPPVLLPGGAVPPSSVRCLPGRTSAYGR